MNPMQPITDIQRLRDEITEWAKVVGETDKAETWVTGLMVTGDDGEPVFIRAGHETDERALTTT